MLGPQLLVAARLAERLILGRIDRWGILEDRLLAITGDVETALYFAAIRPDPVMGDSLR